MPILHISELFALDRYQFVTQAYRNLLQHDPDSQGLAYYMGRLAQGYSKESVIFQLARSPHCRPYQEILGLEALIKSESRAQHWFWKFFVSRNRLEQALREGVTTLQVSSKKQDEGIEQIKLQLAQIHDALTSQMRATEQNIQALHSHLASELMSEAGGKEPLSAESVCQIFQEILGREPENEEVIQQHARLESLEALREALINSDEFQSAILALPEYARIVFLRRLQYQDNR